MPLWLMWSLATIVLWGSWGLVAKIASGGIDAYVNQLLYTAGLLPLMVFVAWTVHRSKAGERRERRGAPVPATRRRAGPGRGRGTRRWSRAPRRTRS